MIKNRPVLISSCTSAFCVAILSCLRLSPRLITLLATASSLVLPLSAAERLITISPVKQGTATEFYVENLQPAEVTVTIEMEIENMESTVPLPHTMTLQPGSRIKALTLSPRMESDSSWSYTYFATWGNMTARHDDNYTYGLPYARGASYPVSQGFHGKYSHHGGDCFAIDWKMPVGTPIHAAREGVVAGIKSDSNIGGGDKKFEWDANYVLIKHSDGTYGHYVHLMKDGVKVKVGDSVQKGQLIGLSGNTGHSTGPHLHFAVFKARDGRSRETIPVKYRTTPMLAEALREGEIYEAVQ
ncbi:MAG: M23 family metallopeptidase [Verrucomicrobiota bacterium]|nr:M23 family metallopeptidase [Verrucomicrobiota bacterium]